MTLDFSVLPHQKKFISAKVNTMLVAGYGAGKSHAGVLKTIFKKMQHPKHKVAYYLPTYPLIKDIAFSKFTEALEDLGLTYKLNKSDKEIHINNYGTIIFRSMDNPETIVGYEVAYSLIDEADILNTEKMDVVYKKILGRNRAIENANVDAVSTPEGFKWLYNMANSGHFNVIKAKTYDNKFLPTDYITQLEDQYPPNLLKAYLEGEFVNLLSGAVYSYYDRHEHDTKRTVKPYDILYIGQDFNVGGCCGRVMVLEGIKGYIVDEYSVHDTYGIVNHLQNAYPGYEIVIVPDASGKSERSNATKTDIRILQEGGFIVEAPSKNPRVKDRVNSVNNSFYHNNLFVNADRCPKTASALEQQAYDKNGEPEKFGGANTIDDSNDALGYIVHSKLGINKAEFGMRKMKPQ